MAIPAPKLDAARAFLAAWAAPGGEAGWARDVRAQAAARLVERGMPHRRDEYWRFTNPASFLDLPGPVSAAPERAVFAAGAALRLVFVDGVFAPGESDAPELAGLDIRPLAQALATDITWAREVFGRLEARGQSPVDRPLAALNTARAAAGVAIRVAATPSRPVHLVYRQSAPGADILLHHVLRLEAGTELALLESGRPGARSNIVIEAEVADGAALNHVRVQGPEAGRIAATALFARLGRAARAKSFTLSVAGTLTRNETVLEFTGEDAVAHVAGASIGGAGYVHDDTVFITHDAVNCESRQVFKKVLRAGATGVFQGKILVKPGAQKTDGYQISQGLLLDADSQFLAKPELEIYADDVACSHGSTCGAVDPTALFYLTSRGIPRAEAQELLVLAFLEEAVAEIEAADLADEIRTVMAAWIAEQRG